MAQAVTADDIREFNAYLGTLPKDQGDALLASKLAKFPEVTAQVYAAATNQSPQAVQQVLDQRAPTAPQATQGTLAGLQTQGAANAAPNPSDIFKIDAKVDQGGTLTINGQPQYIQTADGPQPNPAWATYGDPSKPGTIAWAGAFLTNPKYAPLVPLVKQQIATTGSIAPQLAEQIAQSGYTGPGEAGFWKSFAKAAAITAGVVYGGSSLVNNFGAANDVFSATSDLNGIGNAGNDVLSVDPSAPGYVPPNTPQIPATGQLPSIPSQGVLSGLQNLPTPSVGVDPSAPGYVPPDVPQVPATGQLPATTAPPPLGSVDPSAPGYTPPATAQVPATGQLPATVAPPPIGSGSGGPTGIDPNTGLPIKSTIPFLNSDGSVDWTKLLSGAGTLLSGAAGADASRSYYNTLSDLAKNQWEVGAPSRARYEASMQPGFDPTTIPGYKGLLDSTWKGALSGLSATGGNPFGNPGGLIQATSDVQNKTAAPFLLNYQNQNANTGAIGALAGGYAGSQSNAAGASGAVNNSLSGTLASLLNPTTGSTYDPSKFRLTPI